MFKVKNVHVKVDTLKFSIRDSKHDFLYKTLKPLATGLVKKQIQKAIADAITTGMEYVDGQLVGVRDRMEDAKNTEGETRTQVLQDVSCFTFLFERVCMILMSECRCSNANKKNYRSSRSLTRTTRSLRSSRTRGTRFSLTLGTLPDGSTARRRRRTSQLTGLSGGLMRK